MFTISGEDLYTLVCANNPDNNIAPNKSGIYGFFLCGECVYIGQAKNLHCRLRRHLHRFINIDNLKHRPTNNKYRILKPYIKHLSWSIIECVEDISQLTKIENKWIDYYCPIFNIRTHYGPQRFSGTSEDIDDFVFGLTTMDALRHDYLIRPS